MNRVIFVFPARDHRCFRAFFDSRRQYEGDNKLPEGLMPWSFLRKVATYEPRIAILEIWGETWQIRGKYGIHVAVRGRYGALAGST